VTPAQQALHVAALCGVDATSAEPLYAPVASATRGVWRVTGGPRTAVVKVLQPVVAGEAWRADLDPHAPYYWRRETDFYASPVPAALTSGGLAVPAPYGVVDLPDGTAGICVADVTAAYLPSPWPVATYVRLATATANLATVPLDEAWLSGGWLRAYVARHDSPPWCDTFLGWLDRLPQVLCHFDLSVQNAFAASDPPTVIDWAFAGRGAVGVDAGPLAVESVLDFHLAPAGLGEVAALTHDAYAAAVDHPGDEVRLGLCAGAAVKFAWVERAVRHAAATRPATLNGRPLDDALPVWEACLPHLAELATTARRLAARLHLPDA
jgi:hypothetical protein